MSPRAKNSYRIFALTLAMAFLISAAAIAQQSLSGFSIFSEGNEFSTEIAQAGGGFIEGENYQTEVFTEPLQGKASSAGYSLAVGSADFFSEEPAQAGNQTVPATISSQADKSPPQIISSINYPEQPAVGEEVEFYAEAIDDVSLFSAVLEIDGKNSSTQNLGGKKATASFKFRPESSAGGKLSWRIFISDSSGNEASTERKEFSVLAVAPTSRECKLEEKPKALEAPCANGKKKVYEFSCNSKIGKWDSVSKEVGCLGSIDLNIGDESLPLEKIAAALIAVALGAAGIYEYKKNPEKFRAWILKIKNIFPRAEEKPDVKPPEEKKKEEPVVPSEKKRKRKIPVLKY